MFHGGLGTARSPCAAHGKDGRPIEGKITIEFVKPPKRKDERSPRTRGRGSPWPAASTPPMRRRLSRRIRERELDRCI